MLDLTGPSTRVRPQQPAPRTTAVVGTTMFGLVGHPARSHLPRPMPDAAAGGSADALLDAVGPVDGAPLLLAGAGTLDLMCAAIRRGCVGVSILRSSDKPEAASADIAFVSRAAAPACAHGAHAVTLPARLMRALVPLGILAVQLDAGPTPTSAATARVARALRLHGFMAIRARALPDGRTLLLAERPPTGRLARA